MVLEHRWLAGDDFRGETNGTDLREEIKGLLETIIPQEQERISNAFAQIKFFCGCIGRQANRIYRTLSIPIGDNAWLPCTPIASWR